MTPIRKALTLGALALAVVLVDASSASATMAGLLSSGTGRSAAVPASGAAIGRPPVSQPIPGPVINN